MQEFTPSHNALQYMGRIDMTNPDAPVFHWAGSMVRFCFSGRTLAVTLKDHRLYGDPSIGYVLDGTVGRLTLSSNCNDIPQTVHIPVEKDGRHECILYKRQDATHCFTLMGISLADKGNLIAPPALPQRRMECYGDSVSAGSVVEAYDHVGTNDPPTYDASLDNAWYSYAMQTARLVGAQIHLNAQGGIALLDNTGYFDNGNFGLETAYNKLGYLPFCGCSDWDFSRYTPDVVLFAVGQNDHHVGDKDNCIPDDNKKERWLSTYCAIISDLMVKYPNATFVLLLTVLMHDPFWEGMMDEVCERLASPRVRRFRFKRTGVGTPGHPRVQEQCEMACELSEYLLSFGDQLWASERS